MPRPALSREPEYRSQFPMRLAVTANPYPTGDYPPEGDGPNVYPIVFIDASYPKTAGLQTVSKTDRSANALEYVCNLGTGYLPVETKIWCFFYWKRWWTSGAC
jgi:hypothetical protein